MAKHIKLIGILIIFTLFFPSSCNAQFMIGQLNDLPQISENMSLEEIIPICNKMIRANNIAIYRGKATKKQITSNHPHYYMLTNYISEAKQREKNIKQLLQTQQKQKIEDFISKLKIEVTLLWHTHNKIMKIGNIYLGK